MILEIPFKDNLNNNEVIAIQVSKSFNLKDDITISNIDFNITIRSFIESEDSQKIELF